MPRKTKEHILKDEETKVRRVSKKTKAVSTSKEAEKKKNETNSVNVSALEGKKETKRKTPKKETVSKKTSSTTTKKISAKKETNTTKKTSTKKVANATAKKASTKKTTKTTTKKVANARTNSTKKVTKKLQTFLPEYYDLPFRYNKTVVKILAQTPTNLFVYWEISDEDREKLKNQFGDYFFEITKPVLIVYNETLNYSFEVDVDDFANSWYLHINDSNSEYKIELGRRPIPVNYSYIPGYNVEKQGIIEPLDIPYIYISSSNELEAPNDRILFNDVEYIYFKNIKTNQYIKRKLKDFQNIYKNGKFISTKKIYKNLFKEEILKDGYMSNPSSGNPSSMQLF